MVFAVSNIPFFKKSKIVFLRSNMGIRIHLITSRHTYLRLSIYAYVATRNFRFTRNKYHVNLLYKQHRIVSKSNFSFIFL